MLCKPTFKFFFLPKEAPVFTELSRENDEEKGNFTSFSFINVDAFVLVLLKVGMFGSKMQSVGHCSR